MLGTAAAGLIPLLALLAPPQSAAAVVDAAPPGAPNILLIVTDDQRADTLGVMPRTRSFFQQGGTTFANGFVDTPLCCPSRASIFSGRYTHNHEVWGNGFPDKVAAFDQSSTIQGYLKRSGYQTAIVGKYLNTVPVDRSPLNWDRWMTFPGTYGSAYYNIDGTVRWRSGYSTTLIADRAVQMLQDFESTDSKPWFLYVATHAPHSNFTPEAKYDAAPVPAFVPPPSFNEVDVSDKPPAVKSRSPWPLNNAVTVRAKQLRTLMSVDDMVGRLEAQLSALGETNTLAVFISDNGYLLGEHRIGSNKRFPYEESVKVPYLMRWPGHVPAAAVDRRLALNVDLLPTILDAAGVSPTLTYPLDGRSLLSGSARDHLLLEYFLSNDSPLGPWASTRTSTYQYVEWYSKTTGNVVFREYYNLVADPYQLTNLLADGDPANDPPVATLSARLKTERQCVGSACP